MTCAVCVGDPAVDLMRHATCSSERPRELPAYARRQRRHLDPRAWMGPRAGDRRPPPHSGAVLDEGLRSLDADIVALEKTLLLDDHDQVTEIVPESMHVVHSENRRPHEMGVSIASHWPIRRVEEFGRRL